MSRDEAVKHCKHWASIIRAEGIDLLVSDYGAAIGVSDKLAYPLDMQEWITKESEPTLYELCQYVVAVDNDHTNREAWSKILQLADALL